MAAEGGAVLGGGCDGKTGATLLASAAGADASSLPMMWSGCSVNRDSPIPKNAMIVAAAAIPSPPSERMAPNPKPLPVQPGSESEGAVGGVSGV